MSAVPSGGVFISYRRQEAGAIAGRLYDRLAARFGDAQVFMDVDKIALGVDFAEVITQAVSTSQVLLAVIGPHWLTATDEGGQRRLNDPDDIVRLEIAAALERDIHVIPILVEGAVMPRSEQLPKDLAKLARLNALSVRHESFRADADRLSAAIEPILQQSASHDPVASDPARGVLPPRRTGEPGPTKTASANKTPLAPSTIDTSRTSVTLDRWRTLSIVDRDGGTVGTISEFYLDRNTHHPRWALVNIALLGAARQAFVPLLHATERIGVLQVPYEKSRIKDAPHIDPHGELTPEEETTLFAHHRLLGVATGARRADDQAEGWS